MSKNDLVPFTQVVDGRVTFAPIQSHEAIKRHQRQNDAAEAWEQEFGKVAQISDDADDWEQEVEDLCAADRETLTPEDEMHDICRNVKDSVKCLMMLVDLCFYEDAGNDPGFQPSLPLPDPAFTQVVDGQVMFKSGHEIEAAKRETVKREISELRAICAAKKKSPWESRFDETKEDEFFSAMCEDIEESVKCFARDFKSGLCEFILRFVV
jgi:hypothetical protein